MCVCLGYGAREGKLLGCFYVRDKQTSTIYAGILEGVGLFFSGGRI